MKDIAKPLTKKDEAIKALNCLFIEVNEKIAEDVKQRVLDAFDEIKQEYDRALVKVLYKKENAILYATKYGQIDGDHHKLWTIDQMVRALTGCPTIIETARDYKGKSYEYKTQGESEEYNKLIKDYEYKNDDGKYEDQKIYEWDTGTAP